MTNTPDKFKEAAEQYMIETVVEGGNGDEMENCIADFLAGATFAKEWLEKNPPPEVMALVEALELSESLLKIISELPSYLNIIHRDLVEIERDRIAQALAQFRKGRGE